IGEKTAFSACFKRSKEKYKYQTSFRSFRRSRKSPIFYSFLFFYREKQLEKKQLFQLVLKEAKKSINTKLLLDLLEGLENLRFSIQDRKSTRLNSSHVSISYAVFCLKKKII